MQEVGYDLSISNTGTRRASGDPSLKGALELCQDVPLRMTGSLVFSLLKQGSVKKVVTTSGRVIFLFVVCTSIIPSSFQPVSTTW